MSSFEDRQPGLHPTALRGKWGKGWGKAWGAQKDRVLSAMKDAVKTGFASLAPEDSLPRHAARVGIPLLPGESSDALRARVLGAWDFWPWVGTGHAKSAALALLGYTDAEVYAAREIGAAPWAQWFVVAAGTGVSARPWGVPDTWGTGTWGSNASRDLAQRTRSFLRLVSNARDIGWFVISGSHPGIWGRGGWGSGAAWGGVVTRWRI